MVQHTPAPVPTAARPEGFPLQASPLMGWAFLNSSYTLPFEEQRPGDYNLIFNCKIEGVGGGNDIPWHEGNALNLQNSHHNTFNNIAITDCIHGVRVGYARWGSNVHASNNNMFSNIIINGSRKGIYIRSESRDNRFINNSAINSKQVGAHLESGAFNNFLWCTYRNATVGMLVGPDATDTCIKNCYFGSLSDGDLIDEGMNTVASNNSYEDG